MLTHTRRRAAVAASCLVIAAATTACGQIGGDSAKAVSSGATIDIGNGKITPNKPKRVALIINNDLSATWTVSLVDALKGAAKKADITLDIKYDKLDPTTELANYQSVISSKKYQGLIIQPLTGQLCDPVKKDSLANDLSVVVLMSPLCSDAPDKSTAPWYPGTLTFIGGMNNQAHTVDLMKSAAENSPGPQKVLLVTGTQTLVDNVSFIAGVKKYAATNPDWTLSDTIFTNYTAADAFAKTQNALQGNKGVTMIVTPYAGITEGVIQAVDAQGLTGKIAIYDQVGGSAESVKMIEAGKLTGTLPTYPASIGTSALQAIIDAANGKTPTRFIDDDGNPAAEKGAITKANLSSLKAQFN